MFALLHGQFGHVLYLIFTVLDPRPFTCLFAIIVILTVSGNEFRVGFTLFSVLAVYARPTCKPVHFLAEKPELPKLTSLSSQI